MIAQSLCVHGRPTCVQLSEQQLKLFSDASVAVPENSAALAYSKLHLRNSNRFITAKPTSRSLLRDNSGVMYTDSTGSMCYGQLQNIILLESDQEVKACAVVLQFPPAQQGLCKDSVTNARLNDHLVTLHTPRYICLQFLLTINYYLLILTLP